MRVMLVVNEFPPEKVAGTAMATQALAEYLMVQGHKVCVVVTTSCPTEVQHHITPHDYDLIWLKPRPFRGLGWFWRIGQTFKHAKRFKPDVIQGQAVSCGLIAALVGRWTGVPSICYAQGYDVYQATWLQKKTEIRWGCAWSTQVLAVTADLAANIQRVVSLPPITIMPHAFELPEIKFSREVLRQQYGLLASDSLVFSVGRLEVFKGHDVLLRAWSACLLVNPDAKLWIAGIGSQEEALQTMVYDLGIQSSVKFVGYLSKGEVHQMMEAADLFVLPSRSEP
ncbi:MAG: glycosyltransferase family 4 protein, partial [Mariprofundaceae bacterium]